MTNRLRSSLRPSSAPRRRTTAASVALVLGLALTGCSGGDDDPDDGDGPSASETASGGIPTEAELETALLTTADLPGGFAVAPDDDDDDEGGFEGTCLEDVGDFAEALGAEPDAEAEVELGLESPTTQSAVNSQVEAYEDPSNLAIVFETFTANLQQCTSIQTTEDDVDFDLAVAYDDTVDLPGADDQLAFDLTGTISSGEESLPVTYRFVVALSGSLISVVGVYSLGDDTTGVLGTIDDLAVLQAERVAELG